MSTPESSTARRAGAPLRFFESYDFEYQARLAVGLTTQHVGDIGIVMSTLSSITDGDLPGWFRAWSDTGARLEGQAQEAQWRGDDRTARWASLAASEAYSRSLAFVDGMEDSAPLLPTFALHRANWDAVIDLSRGHHVRVDVPYEDTTLPGFLLRPDDSGTRRPTLIITNGSDGGLSTLWGFGIAAGLQRGYNVFVYDGPGQQSMLFDEGLPLRYDWEAVMTPVVDTVLSRNDVDAEHLFAYSVSQGGYWLPRALAFEKRFRAAAVDPGVVEVRTIWSEGLTGDDQARARSMGFRGRAYGAINAEALLSELSRYQLRDVASSISTPMLILEAEDEFLWPGQSRELYDLLPGEKELVTFREVDGANMHAQPLGRRITELKLFDFFAAHS